MLFWLFFHIAALAGRLVCRKRFSQILIGVVADAGVVGDEFAEFKFELHSYWEEIKRKIFVLFFWGCLTFTLHFLKSIAIKYYVIFSLEPWARYRMISQDTPNFNSDENSRNSIWPEEVYQFLEDTKFWNIITTKKYHFNLRNWATILSMHFPKSSFPLSQQTP